MANQRPKIRIPLTFGTAGVNRVANATFGTSQIIDCSDFDIADFQGYMSMMYSVAGTFSQGGTTFVGTCGTTTFTYQVSNLREGIFFTPSQAQPIGTSGTQGTTDLAGMYWGTSNIYTPVPPWLFMCIKATVGTGGTSGITADLIVR